MELKEGVLEEIKGFIQHDLIDRGFEAPIVEFGDVKFGEGYHFFIDVSTRVITDAGTHENISFEVDARTDCEGNLIEFETALK